METTNSRFFTQEDYELLVAEINDLEAHLSTDNNTESPARYHKERIRLKCLRSLLPEVEITRPIRQDIVSIGSLVTLQEVNPPPDLSGKVREPKTWHYEIGSYLPFGSSQRISYDSGIGRRLLSCRVGATIEIDTRKFVIVSIN